MRMTLAAAAAALLLLPAAAGAQTYPEPKEPGQDRPQAEGAVQDPHGLQEEEQLRLPQHPEGGQQGQGGRQDRRAQGRLQGVGDDQRRKASATCGSSAMPQARPRRARGLAARSRTASSSTSADQVTIDGFTARNYKANGFFVDQRRRLQADPPRRRQVGRLRRLRVQLQGRRDVALGGLLPLRRGLLHRPDAAAVQARSARSCATSRAGATRSASRPPTCAT